jgi:hypothetical protein
LCIHHTDALLREWTRWRATARAQRAHHLPGQPLMLTDHEEAPTRVDLGEKGAGAKIAIGDPQIIPRDAREDRPEEGALLRMAIFTGKDIRDEPLGRLIDHQRFAGQGAPCGLPQFLEAMLTGCEAVAIDNFDPIACKPRGALTRIVKIFELAFPLEVTPFPSPALRLVFRSTLTHTQRQYDR